MSNLIIGLTGRAGAGKDTLGRLIKEHHDVELIAFADPLRDFVYDCNPLICNDIYLQDVIDRCGWQGYKETQHAPEIRRVVQRFGTEGVRNHMGANTWVSLAMDRVKKSKASVVVLTDVRFSNEFNAVARAGGVNVGIVRSDGIRADEGHSSESEVAKLIKKADVVIENDRNPEDMYIDLTYQIDLL